ncbi:helix-turn-helix domain-containing protein [Streptomyces sp. NPDC055722]
MSMSRTTTRRLVVAHLTDRGMSPQKIADELEVSRETVRRDLLNAPPVEAANEAPDVAAEEPGLCIPHDAQLGPDTRLVAASYKAPAESVARKLLHLEAEAIRARVHARFAATPET